MNIRRVDYGLNEVWEATEWDVDGKPTNGEIHVVRLISFTCGDFVTWAKIDSDLPPSCHKSAEKVAIDQLRSLVVHG